MRGTIKYETSAKTESAESKDWLNVWVLVTEMKLWNRTSGVFKDRNSLLLTTLRRKTTLRNPDIEASVIRATNHDEFSLNHRYSSRVLAWLRISPAYAKPLVWAITYRAEKTRSWIVALKSLMLMHGVFCCKVIAIERIGRLPFDLSNFRDRNSDNEVICGYNDFIRAYYSFLDQKSSFIFLHAQERRTSVRHSRIADDQRPKPASNTPLLMQDLVSLQTMQGLLDSLLRVKPETCSMNSYRLMSPLIIEAMDNIVIELFDVYSRICRAIAMVLSRVESAGTAEASLALKIMKIALSQSEQLSLYLEFCQNIGVPNAEDCPKLKPVPEEDIKELENVLAKIFSAKSDFKSLVVDAQTQDNSKSPDLDEENHKSLVVVETNNVHKKNKSNLKTIITSNWEVFEDDYTSTNPFLTPFDLPLLALDPPPQELPDLISFD